MNKQDMSKIKRLLIAGFIGFFVFTSVFSIAPKVQAAAGINQTINFQGKVANTNGTNVSNGNYDFVFRLYKASSGGVAQWTETWNSGTSQVAVADGVFQVALGTHQSLASLDFNDDSWYLTVEFNGDGEMDPRMRFTAVPYAFNAKKVSGLTVQDSAGGADTTGTLKVADGSTLTFSADFTTSGDDALTFTTSAATNVTLPTTGTLATLAGTEEFTNKTIGSTGLTFSGASTDITTASNQDLTLTAAGTGDVVVSTDTDTQFRIVASAAPGVDIMDLTNASQGTTTTDVDGLSIAFTQGDDADATDTNSGIHVAITNSSDNADTLYGILLDGITGSAAAETALSIGAGWDTGINMNANTIVNIGNSGTDFDTSGGLTLAADLAVNGDDITSDGTSLKLETGGTGTTAVLQVGQGGAGSATPDYFALDVKSDTGDPGSGAEGYMYYNTFDNKFRCYQNSGWTDCIGAGGTTTLQQAYDAATPTILTDASGDLIIQVIGGATDTQFEVNAASAPEIDMVNFTNTGQGTVTNGVDGLSLTFLQGDDADGGETNAALHLAVDSATTDADTLYGIQIDSLTAGAETATAISIGSSWDTGIDLNATTLVNIGDANTDFTSTGGLTLADILTVNDDVDVNLAAGENATIAATAAPTADLLAITNSGQGTVTNGVDGLSIAFTQGDDADGGETNAALNIAVTDSSDDADTLYGINIANIGGGQSTYTALNIGTGWFTGINLNAGTILNIGNAATDFTSSGGLTLADDLDMTNDPILNIGNAGTDFDTSGGLTLADDLAVNGDDITSDGTSLKVQVGASGASTIATFQIGVGGAGSTTPDFLGLDVKSDTGDPAGGAEGYMYYNTADNKFRCYENTAWTNCIGSGGPGGGSLQDAYDYATPTILTDGSGDVIIQVIGGATDTQFEINAASAPEVDMVNITNSGQNIGTDGVDGLSVTLVQGSGTNITNAGAHLTITGSGDTGDTVMGLRITATGATNNTQYGAYISSITGGSGAETALYIGAGWDTGIDINANTLVNIGHADTDFTSTGGLTVGGDVLTVNDDVDVNLDSGENLTILALAGQTADMLFLSSNGQTTTTNGVDAIHAVLTQGNDGDASDSNAGLHLDFNSNSGNADNLYGVWIGNLTAGAATEIGLNVGTGWDRGLSIADANTYSILLASDDGDAASGMTFGSTSAVSMFKSASNVLTIGNTTDGFSLDVAAATSASNGLYRGATRPSKTITLSPEYPGASLSAFYGAGTESSATVTVTSDVDSTANAFKNYYTVVRSAATLNSYTVAVKMKLPKDFAIWETSNAIVINYVTNSTSSANNFLNYYLYKVDDTTSAITSATNQVSGVAATWTTASIDDSVLDDGSAPEWDAADEEVILFLRMGSQSGNYVRIGDITLNYKAAF